MKKPETPADLARRLADIEGPAARAIREAKEAADKLDGFNRFPAVGHLQSAVDAAKKLDQLGKVKLMTDWATETAAKDPLAGFQKVPDHEARELMDITLKNTRAIQAEQAARRAREKETLELQRRQVEASEQHLAEARRAAAEAKAGEAAAVKGKRKAEARARIATWGTIATVLALIVATWDAILKLFGLA